MNNIDFTRPGGLQTYQDQFGFMQQAFLEAFQGLCSAYPAINGNPAGHPSGAGAGPQCIVLSGCSFSFSPSTGSVVSPGFIIIDNEVLFFAGAQLSVLPEDIYESPGYGFALQVSNHPVLDPANYQSGATANIHQVRRAVLVASGTRALFGYVRRMSDYYSAPVWRTVGTGSNPNFGAGWGAIPAFPLLRPQFCKRPDGQVHLRGWAQQTGQSSQITIFTLPAGYRPTRVMAFPVTTPGSVTASYTVQINPDGTVYALNYTAPAIRQLSLDGISFFIE